MTAPWFKMYSADFLLDSKLTMICLEARAIIVMLWCVCHRDVSFPDNPDLMSKMINVDTRTMRKHWPVVRKFFDAGIGGLYSNRMEKERKDYEEKCAKLRANASHGGKARAKQLLEQSPSKCLTKVGLLNPAEVEENRTEHIYATDSELAFASLKAIWPKGRINGATLDDLATAGGDPDAIVLAAQAFLADPVACSSEKFAPSLGTWLKDRRFEPYLGTTHDEGPIVTVADPLAVS